MDDQIVEMSVEIPQGPPPVLEDLQEHPLYEGAARLWLELFPMEFTKIREEQHQEELQAILTVLSEAHNSFLDMMVEALGRGMGDGTKRVTKRKFLRQMIQLLNSTRIRYAVEAAGQ